MKSVWNNNLIPLTDLSSLTPPFFSRPEYDSLLKVLWRPEHMLGRGNFSTVHPAWDTVTGQWVALKIFSGVRPESRLFAAREVEVLHLLRHPNVVWMMRAAEADAGSEHRAIFEVVPKNLSTLCTGKNAAADVVKIITFLVDCASALEYAHELGILHGDVKPNNIALTDEGVPKFLDFGGAITLWEIPGIKSFDVSNRCLSLLYASRGALLGETASAYFDIHGLAAVGRELLLQARPFQSFSSTSLIREKSRAVTWPHRLQTFVPQSLLQLLTDALDEQSTSVPKSMKEFKERLVSAKQKML